MPFRPPPARRCYWGRCLPKSRLPKPQQPPTCRPRSEGRWWPAAPRPRLTPPGKRVPGASWDPSVGGETDVQPRSPSCPSSAAFPHPSS
eukprot:1661387-Prymnesium_polylepis.1